MNMHFLNKEQKLIARIKDILGPAGRFIGDDCAVLPGKMLVTTDTLVEKIHFSLDWTGFTDLGWKALAVNLSDIAAMAGKSKYALIVLSAPEELYLDDKIISLYEGIKACAAQYNTLIVGGDITRGQCLSITITVIGEANDAGVLMRNGAKPGDVVVVTGDFGASGAGLRYLQKSGQVANQVSGHYEHCLQQFLCPSPKLIEASLLVETIGSRGALMDASDGLADALLQISQASNVGMQIDLKAIPIHEQTNQFALQNALDPLDLALYAGEDYQLVACLDHKKWQIWQKEYPAQANSFQQIGTVTDSKNIQLMFGNEEGHKLDPKRIFQHIA